MAFVIGRLMLGPELYRDSTWVNQLVEDGYDIYEAADYLNRFPAFLRPCVATINPRFWRLKRKQQIAKGILIPVLKRRAQLISGDVDNSRRPDHNDFMQWMLEASQKQSTPYTFEKLAELLMLIHMDGTTALRIAAQLTILDLATHVDAIPRLLEEINQVWPDNSTHPTRDLLMNLIKLDSFMKESQRMNPPLLGTTSVSVS